MRNILILIFSIISLFSCKNDDDVTPEGNESWNYSYHSNVGDSMHQYRIKLYSNGTYYSEEHYNDDSRSKYHLNFYTEEGDYVLESGVYQFFPKLGIDKYYNKTDKCYAFIESDEITSLHPFSLDENEMDGSSNIWTTFSICQ